MIIYILNLHKINNQHKIINTFMKIKHSNVFHKSYKHNKNVCIQKQVLKLQILYQSFKYDYFPKHDGQGDVLSIACSFQVRDILLPSKPQGCTPYGRQRHQNRMHLSQMKETSFIYQKYIFHSLFFNQFQNFYSSITIFFKSIFIIQLKYYLNCLQNKNYSFIFIILSFKIQKHLKKLKQNPVRDNYFTLNFQINTNFFQFNKNFALNFPPMMFQAFNSTKKILKIIVAGGDGFIGWPLALRLSNIGHEVLIIDNLSRRRIDQENGYCSVTPIASIQQRLEKWKQLTEKTITFAKIDIARDQKQFQATFQAFNPDVIVHLAQQRAAPYSMKSIETIDYTFTNNTQSTKNILVAIMKFNKGCHLVHIGTMGVYGYGAVEGSTIPQGYCMAKLNCDHKEKCQCPSVEIVHPYYPGSVYHMTKCLDNVTLLNFHKYFGLKITQLHQGIVWGVSTEETQMHDLLVNRVDVDSDYGTVLNRFCAQVANNYPMTIYGTGGQTRGFINIRDSIKCVTLAIQHGARNEKFSQVEILNQMTETISLNQLKNLLIKLYPEAKYENIENPRIQKSDNSLIAQNQKFKKLGHEGLKVNEQDIKSLVEACKKNKQRFELNLPYIKPISFWRK